MDLRDILRSNSCHPIPHQLLSSYLKEYKRPNDKIKALKDKGLITSLKKGLYIAGPALKANKPDPFLIANHLLGPSYISNESALSYYGLIPERVFTTRSVTIKASKEFITPAGRFTYTHVDLPYYAFGINSAQVSGDLWALVASPEKAVCDKIITTQGLLLRSANSAFQYLVEDLRIEESRLKELNTILIKGWIKSAPKKDSLLMAVKMIEKL